MDYSRNIKNYAFEAIINTEKRDQVVNKINFYLDQIRKQGILNLKQVKFSENQNEGQSLLEMFGVDYPELMKTLQKMGIKNQWPENREIYVNEADDEMVLVNFQDHFRFLTRHDNSFTSAYKKLVELHNKIEKDQKFEYHNVYGFLNTSPTHLGAGLEIFAVVKVDKLWMNPKFSEVKACLPMRIHEDGPDEYLMVSARHKLCQTEDEFVEDFYDQVRSLILLNRDFKCLTKQRKFL